MGAVVALGDETVIGGWRIAGVRLVLATDTDGLRRAWANLAPDVELVLLTPAAADCLGTSRCAPGRPLTVVLPS